MIPVPGSNLIQYHDLSQTQEGLDLWRNYMEQVRNISLQYPQHFMCDMARSVIPKDAERYKFFAYLEDTASIDAFCVVAVTCDQAEYLWAASHRDKKGRMQRLYWFIEDHILEKEPQVQKIIGMCASLDSRMVRDQALSSEEKELREKSWRRTHTFHYRMNFDFSYKLEDFWGEGYHALVFMKPRANFGIRRRRECQPYGYTPPPEIDKNLSPPTQETDKHPSVNQKVQEQIRKYLDAFDESFIRNVQPGTPETEKHVFLAESGARLKGFTGLALINPHSKTAVAFAQTSAIPRPAKFKMRFEYGTESSSFLKLLTSAHLAEPTGFLVYRSDPDEGSDLNIRSFFDTFYGPSDDTDYTVFYCRRPGSNGHYSVLYFVTPRIANVVWYKSLWDSFANYSFALMLETYSYFTSLSVLESGLRENDYFKSLIDAVSPTPTSGVNDDFLSKIARMKDAIQERIDAHYWAVVRSKESAIAHYGHTLGHRLSPIQAYVEGNKDSLKRAVTNAKFLGDLSVVLQAINLASTEELYRHPKKSRFLKYAREDGPLNIAEKIRNEWPMLAESFQPTTLEGDDTSQMRVMVLIQFSGCLPDSDLDYMLVDTVNGEACRPCEAFYSQLFSELLLNVVRYGVIPRDEFDLAAKQGHVLVELAFQDISCGDRTLPCIVMSNLIGKKSPPPWLRKTCWTPWPADRENDGPGMAIAVLRRLGLGELYYRYEPTYRLFDVAVWLRGLRTKEN